MMAEHGTTAWEYHALPETERHELAALGMEGWELVALGGEPGERLLYLKRPALGFRERITLDQRRAYFNALGLEQPATLERGA